MSLSPYYVLFNREQLNLRLEPQSLSHDDADGGLRRLVFVEVFGSRKA